MKLIFAVAATLIAFSAQANDRKVGNVIAVERQIINLYDRCLSKVSTDVTKDASFYICSFNFLKSPAEMPITKGAVIRYSENNCQVFADTANGSIMMSFGVAKGVSNFATAKNCLAQATQKTNSTNVTVYTIE